MFKNKIFSLSFTHTNILSLLLSHTQPLAQTPIQLTHTRTHTHFVVRARRSWNRQISFYLYISKPPLGLIQFLKSSLFFIHICNNFPFASSTLPMGNISILVQLTEKDYYFPDFVCQIFPTVSKVSKREKETFVW